MYAYMALSFFLSPLQQLHSSFCGDFQNGSQEWVFFLHHVEFFSFADEARFAFYAEAGALVAVSSFDFSCAECHDDAVVDGKVFFQVVHAGCGSEDPFVIGDNEVGIPCVCDMGDITAPCGEGYDAFVFQDVEKFLWKHNRLLSGNGLSARMIGLMACEVAFCFNDMVDEIACFVEVLDFEGFAVRMEVCHADTD